MVAVPAQHEPTSLIESFVAWVGRRAKRRAARTGRPPGNGALGFWLAELSGTLTAAAVFVYGAFVHLLPGLGYAVLGAAVLVLDTKISGGRRKRRDSAAARPPVAPARKPVTYS